MDVGCLAQWKAMTLSKSSEDGLGVLQSEQLNVTNITTGERAKIPFPRRGRLDLDSYYLFEEKEYDMNITDKDKGLLKERIQKLVSLPGDLRCQRCLHTLHAVDYTDDPEFHCWWLVFHFPPLSLSPNLLNPPPTNPSLSTTSTHPPQSCPSNNATP